MLIQVVVLAHKKEASPKEEVMSHVLYLVQTQGSCSNFSKSGYYSFLITILLSSLLTALQLFSLSFELVIELPVQ